MEKGTQLTFNLLFVAFVLILKFGRICSMNLPNDNVDKIAAYFFFFISICVDNGCSIDIVFLRCFHKPVAKNYFEDRKQNM